MGHVVGFTGQKGGSGKSVLATSTAVYATQGGAAVSVIDLDYTQQTSKRWATRRKENGHKPDINVISAPRAELSRTISKSEADFIILDTAGWADELSVWVASHCHMVVLPTGTGLNDLDTTILVAHEMTAKGVNRDSIFFAITKAPDEARVKQAKEYIHEAGYKTLKGFSRFAKAIEAGQDQGLAIHETSFKKLRDEAILLIEDIGTELVKPRSISLTITPEPKIRQKEKSNDRGYDE